MRVIGKLRLGLVLTVFVAPLTAPLARAQSTVRNPAAAQALFDEARRALDAGRYAEACPKFRESFDLDPGGGTLLNLADCYERQGLSASAWSTFKDARVFAERDGRKDRVKYASEHIGQLESKLAYLTVRVPEGSRVPGIKVSVDGAPIGEAAWGVALPVDPGKRFVRAEAPGKQSYERVVEVPKATLVREALEIPPLLDAVVDGPEPLTPVLTSDGGGGPEDTPHDGRATAGWIVGGAGLVALGVGGYFGLSAMSDWSDRNDRCRGGCTAEAKAAGDDALKAANIATVGAGVGLLGLGVGTFLLLTSGDAPEQSAASAPPRRQRIWVETCAGGGQVLLRSQW